MSNLASARNKGLVAYSTGFDPGELHIFLGYAKGVGKTDAMLKSAVNRGSEGIDLVLACVQTHGSPDLEALVKNLSSTDRNQDPMVCESPSGDLDVEAILERRPSLVLVDDLAHSNIAGARHSRRFQDVKELLDAGIDVYATLNVQNVESLVDIVAQITGVTVEETVPDQIIDRANQIELVDVSPDDLIKRLHDGRVHHSGMTPEEAKEFYRPGNLTALRLLAMRQAVRRIDQQMHDYMQTREIPGPWAASERMLVCISTNPLCSRLVRTGYRLAQELGAPWYVIYVEAPATSPLSDENRKRLNMTMRLAESLGANTTFITGDSVAGALLRFARENNVTKIIVGQPRRSRWQELVRGSIVNSITRDSGHIDVYVISSGSASTDSSGSTRPAWSWHTSSYLWSAIAIMLATLAGHLVNVLVDLDPANLVTFYLVAVMVVALRLGYGPAVAASVLSVFVFNFFFVPPRYTLQVVDAEYLLTFLGLLVAGVVIANLTASARQQTATARRREWETLQLLALSRELSTTVDSGVLSRKIAFQAQQTFGGSVCVLLQGHDLTPVARTDNFDVSVIDHDIAEWVLQNGRPAGRDSDTMAHAEGRYVPLQTSHRTIGVMVLLHESISVEQQRLMDAFAGLASMAIEAIQLKEEAQHAQLLRDREKLQSAVLSSMSHDLRTPLAAITGSLSSLRDTTVDYDAATRKDLLDGAYLEATRLNRLVGNLLDMSRLEAGSLTLKRDLFDLQDMVGIARAYLRERLVNRVVNVDLEPDLPLLSVDQSLFVQVLVNLLDNALKYSEPGSPIDISVTSVEGRVCLEIADRGMGIPEEELPRIFEKFYRAKNARGRAGSGLGLSICQGIIEAHGGTVAAHNREGGGTCFRVTMYVGQGQQPE